MSVKKTSTLRIPELWHAWDRADTSTVVQALQDLPDDAPAVQRTLRGLALLDTEQPAEAARVLQSVLHTDPQNPVAALFLLLALHDIGEHQRAGELLLHETVLHPHRGFITRFLRRFWPLRFTTTLGRALATIGPISPTPDPNEMEFQQLVEGVHAPTEEPPPAEEAGEEMARHLREMQDEDGRLARRRRRLAARYLRTGTSRFFAGNHQLAHLAYERAWRLRPLSEQVASHFAYVSLLIGQAQQAEAALQPILTRSVAAYRKSRSPQALPSPDTVVCFAWCLHEAGRHREALQLLATVSPEGPEDYGACFIAAMCWLMLGEEETFQEALEESLTRHFIDTWEQLVRPFLLHAGRWLAAGGPDKGK